MKNILIIGLITVLLASKAMGLKLQENTVQHQYTHLGDDLATHYQGKIAINIQKDTPKVINLWISVFRQTIGCSSKLCLKGWVDKYSEVEDKQAQQVYLGYTNSNLNPKPFFSFSANSDTDFQIITPPGLDSSFAQIIYISCQKLNVLDRKSVINRYQVLGAQLSHKISNNEINKFANVQISNAKISAIQVAKFEKAVPINGFKISQSIANDVIVLDKSQLIGSRKQNYNFNFVTDKKQSFEDTQLASFAGKINVDLNIIGTSSQAAILQQINTQLANLGTRKVVNTQQSLVAVRISANQKFASIDKQPVISPVRFANERTINVNIAHAPTTLHRLTTNKINYQTIGQNIQIDLANVQHLQASKSIINQKKVIYSKTILGKKVQVSVGLVCDLLLTSPKQQVKCTSKLYYTLFGTNKQFTIFTFTKAINLQWSWKDSWSGSWSFSVSVPLPPPVSFITINFYFSIKYNIGASVQISIISQNPFKYGAKIYASTQLDTDSRASLRVIAIEGGVFIKGTLVKAQTDPSLILTYVNTKLITVSLSWYFAIKAFVLEWGFFYRYYKLFSGWSGVKVIASWKINGVSGKWPIITKTWNINL